MFSRKLKVYGIHGNVLSWFLAGRKQRVIPNGTKSGWAVVLSGIPQGNVLGPILLLSTSVTGFRALQSYSQVIPNWMPPYLGD